MRRKLATQTLVAILAALTLAVTAGADPISVQPLRDAGYTVGLASSSGDGCTTWAVSGHGVSTYVNDCDAAAASTIASLTDATLIFERDWQLNHPDQVQAAQTIAASCYSISRTAPATDQWHVVGGTTDANVSGADLPGLAGSLLNLRQKDGACPTGTTAAVLPGTGTVTTTNPDGTTTTTTIVTVPGAPTVAAAITTQAQALAAAAAAAAAPQPPSGDPSAPAPVPVDPSSYTIVEAPADVAAETGIVAWVNTPYMGVMVTADQVPAVTG